MEADTSLVRANGVVELYAIADVILNFALVVNPCYTEGDNTVGLYHALYDFVALEFGMLVVYLFYRHQHFAHCLKILFLARVLGLKGGHDTVDIHDF